MNLKEELEKRWFLYQFSDEKLFDVYNKWWEILYCGFDPSADSLHLGNFVWFMAAVNFMKRKNKFLLLIGWATWMIWDPGGKDSERKFLDEATLRHNQDSIYNQVKPILENLKKLSGYDFDFGIVNNYDFYKWMWYLDFLRKVWKYITVNQMMNKETVKKRIEDPEKSISYTEFSYMLLQWYDFYKLFTEDWVKLQIWWSDQWWNLVTWVEIIRKKEDKDSYVMTFPLIVDSTGKKFGKSEWNAIWLDPTKNSPYFVYQYFMNTTDTDVERFLKLLTLLDFDKIEEIVNKHNEKPELRFGQKQLAKYVVETIFGAESAVQAEKISEILFGTENKLELLKSMSENDIKALQKETGWTSFNEWKILDILVETWLVESRGEWKKMIESWAIFVNENKIEDINFELTNEVLLNWKVALIRKWKKNYKTLVK